MSLDGVMQAPGGPEENPSGGFKFGGWTFPYFDDFAGQVMGEQMGKPFDLLLGRKTYDIFAGYWPKVKPGEDLGLNGARKYVVSKKLMKATWNNSFLIKGNVVKKIKELKEQDGPQIQVHGSADLIQTLLKHGLVDELLAENFSGDPGQGQALVRRRHGPGRL